MYIKKYPARCAAALCCLDAGAIVPAGAANTRSCDQWGGETMPLATIYFPDQDYSQGFCPCEALKKGTLFPELVM